MADRKVVGVLKFSDESLPPALAANAFLMSRVGGTAELLVGFHDVVKMAAEVEKAQEQPDDAGDIELEHDVEILGRFLLNEQSVYQLKLKVDRIFNAMVTSGNLKEGDVVIVNEEEAGEDK